MERGWIKLWRRIEDSEVFMNEGLLQVWIYCLLRATHKHRHVPVKTGKGSTIVTLEPGQFIFGRFEAAKMLRQKPTTTHPYYKGDRAAFEEMRRLHHRAYGRD